MAGEDARHPVEVLSVRLANDEPARNFENEDVAFIPVTRFNLRLSSAKNSRSAHLEGRHLYESPEYNAFWLDRIDIFERVCVPSVLNLVPRPDAWYILFGEMRPPYIRALIERLAAYPWIKPYYRDRRDPNAPPPLKQVLGEHVRALGKTHLCSTRFDSDDSLHQQFYGALDNAISQIRTRGMGEETRCLNLLYGIVESGGALSVYLRRTNMFASIFECAEGLGGPYRGAHDEIRRHMPVVEVITNMPMWIYRRHGNTMDPPGVMVRDRLPLPNLEQYFAPFGLQPGAATAYVSSQGAQVTPPTSERDLRALATELRESPYWNVKSREAASELAMAMHLPKLAKWIASSTDASAERAGVCGEIESGGLTFLNAATHAQLARALEEDGRPIEALRLYDYAIQLTPADRHLRAARDQLAGSLRSALDLEEQMELADIERRGDGPTNAVVIVALEPEPDSEPAEAEQMHERATYLVQQEFAPHVVTLMHAGCDDRDTPRKTVSRDGVTYAFLAAEPEQLGEDAVRRSLTRQLATYVAGLRPCLLATDGSGRAQSITAAIARAFRIPVEL